MREIETKFDISPDFTVPTALRRVTGPDGRVDVDTVLLTSTYHDTESMDLLRGHITLRRRIGPADTGWQLKVPGDGFRTELHWPVRGATIPRPMNDLLKAFVRGARLVPAIRLEVSRTRHRLFDADGVLLAEIAEDDVLAVGLQVQVRASKWQELEAELGPGGDANLLAKIDRILRKAGAVPSTSSSKLARAVAGIGNESLGADHTSAGAVLVDYIGAQADALIAGHFAIHEDEHDSVHQTRVAGRRLRSTLRTFAAYFDTDAATTLGEQLRWYAEVLGSVRDLEVLRERLADAVAELPSNLIAGPVGERIDARLAEQLATARSQVLAVQDGDRYAQLLERVIGWRDHPPFTPAADRPAASLARAVEHAERVLSKRLKRATSGNQSDRETDTEMHAARKAGKRARYAAEATGGDESAAVKQAKELQDLLGEFQDSVVAIELLLQLADDARAADEDTFTYGVLVANQRRRADVARSQARQRVD